MNMGNHKSEYVQFIPFSVLIIAFFSGEPVKRV